MEDWNKFGDSEKERYTQTDRSTQDYYAGYSEPVNTKQKEPKYVTKKAFVITLIFAMILSAAVGAGADGLMVEVHNDPGHALCDGAQSITPDQFLDLNQKIQRVREAIL